MSPALWLLIASIVGNALISWAYLNERDTAIEARAEVSAKAQELAGVRGAAQACSTAVGELRTLADKRLLEAESARRAAASRASKRNQRADAILAAPPAVPGDMCASARARVDAWLQGRVQP